MSPSLANKFLAPLQGVFVLISSFRRPGSAFSLTATGFDVIGVENFDALPIVSQDFDWLLFSCRLQMEISSGFGLQGIAAALMRNSFAFVD